MSAAFQAALRFAGLPAGKMPAHCDAGKMPALITQHEHLQMSAAFQAALRFAGLPAGARAEAREAAK